MRRAVAELGKLEDMERSVEEQESEVRALEARIERQREMLGRMGNLASGMLEGRVNGVEAKVEDEADGMR